MRAVRPTGLDGVHVCYHSDGLSELGGEKGSAVQNENGTCGALKVCSLV